MASSVNRARGKPLFSVFSDDALPTPADVSQNSDKHHAGASKRLKTASSGTTASSKSSKIQIFRDEVLASQSHNKENVHPVSGKRSGLSARDNKLHARALGQKELVKQQKTPQLEVQNLWGGKVPFAPASPEVEPSAKSRTCQSRTARGAETIYELPSIPARACDSAPYHLGGPSSLRGGIPKRAAVPAGSRVSRPNKKREVDQEARRLTESPLAEITQAYIGSGLFQASPVALPRKRIALIPSEDQRRKGEVNAQSLPGGETSNESLTGPTVQSYPSLANITSAARTSTTSSSPKSVVLEAVAYEPSQEHELPEIVDHTAYLPRSGQHSRASNESPTRYGDLFARSAPPVEDGIHYSGRREPALYEAMTAMRI